MLFFINIYFFINHLKKGDKMAYLDKIDTPKDIKNLSLDALEAVAQEIRKGILLRDSTIGGHVGPNLGIVEATIALHYVFNSPVDKIVWDVSHQCYPHKMLTGRKHGFLDMEKMASVTGYTNPNESEHDFFTIGHTSTSVSLASGLAKARDLQGQHHNIIAVIGDGSLSGGEALEGLSNASVLDSNIIIVVNDNEMSIAENHGGIYTSLRELRATNGTSPNNLFKAMGFQYHYVENGNDIATLIDAFKSVKDTNKPTVIHIHTDKGHGYALAEKSKERWHWSIPFDIETGEGKFSFSDENYAELTYQFLSEKIKKDKRVVILTAGTPGLFALTKERREALGANFVDVGIAEEQAVAMSSALAKGGCKPVFCVWSSFIQRTYDQLSQDLALNNNPAVILVTGGGISGMDDTHLGTFDIPMISNIPNLVHLAPATREEYFAMLDWALEQNQYAVVLRQPNIMISSETFEKADYGILNKSQVVHKGSKVAILALGSFFKLGLETQKALQNEGIDATLINPRYISGLDTELLESLTKDHSLIVTLEDGQAEGGYGAKVASFYGTSAMKVLVKGSPKEFTDRESAESIYERNGLTPPLLTKEIMDILA